MKQLAATVVVVLALMGLEHSRQPVYDLLTLQADRIHVSLALSPGGNGRTDPGTGIRSLTLHGLSLVICETLLGPDGRPTTASVVVSKDEMVAIVDVLRDLDGLRDLRVYYSEAVADPTGPPPASERCCGPRAAPPSCRISVGRTSDGYHSYYVSDLSWGPPTDELLGRLGSELPQLAPVIQPLIETCRRMQ